LVQIDWLLIMQGKPSSIESAASSTLALLNSGL
jgi:hypothetical protein